jgi:hypothetical protein
LAPKDLGVPREQSPAFCATAKSRVWHATKKEEKTAKNSVTSERFWLFTVLLGRIPTGSTFSAPRSHQATELTTFYHFVPHLSRKSFIVKQKLAGTHPTYPRISEITKACG